MLEAEREMRKTLGRHTLAGIAGVVAGKVSTKHKQATQEWFAERAESRSPGRRPAIKKEEL